MMVLGSGVSSPRGGGVQTTKDPPPYYMLHICIVVWEPHNIQDNAMVLCLYVKHVTSQHMHSPYVLQALYEWNLRRRESVVRAAMSVKSVA